jgi:hypothetical protein
MKIGIFHFTADVADGVTTLRESATAFDYLPDLGAAPGAVR